MTSDLHDLLVQKAARWCLRSRSCTFALCEPYSACMEQPDVLAWTMGGWSVLVECKASRADFLADKKKTFRDPRLRFMSLGQERWYAVGPSVATADDCPDGWGLLVLTKGGRFRRLCEPPERQGPSDPDIQRKEFSVLLPALRKAWSGKGNASWLRFNPYPPGEPTP